MYKIFLLFALSPLFVGCSSLRSRSTASLDYHIHRKWVRSTLSQENHEYRHPNYMPPILTDDLIVQGNSIDGIAAFEKKSGAQKWKLQLNGGVEGGATLYDDNIYFGANDGYFYSIKLSTGQKQWSFPIRFEGLGQPYVHGELVYFQTGNNSLFALRRSTGELIWTYNRKEASNLSVRTVSKPSSDGKALFVGFSDGYLLAFDLAKGNVLWESYVNLNNKFKDVDSQPVVERDRVYISSYDGGLYCLEKSEGKIIWKLEVGGFTSPTIGDDSLYYASDSGRLYSIDKKSGKVNWDRKVDHGQATQPLLYNGLLVYGESEGDLILASSTSGEPLARYSPGRGLLSKPAIDTVHSHIYFISNSANLHAVEIDRKEQAKVWGWEKEPSEFDAW